MLEDLTAALGDDKASESEPYFLGSIVLAKDRSSPDAEVIDGQQRLTTLTILLAVLAEVLPEEKADEVWRFILQKGMSLVGQEDRPRLSIRSRDQDFFREYVQTAGRLEDLIARDGKRLTDSQNKIRTNAELYYRTLSDRSLDACNRLATYILTQCYLVVVSTPDRDSAYRVFTVLNDRGLELSHSDILKSEIIGEVESDNQGEYTTLWESAEEELGRDSFEDLFSHIRMIYAKYKQKTTVLDEFRKEVVAEAPSPSALVDDIIVPYADLYAELVNAPWDGQKFEGSIESYLRWLHRLDNNDWIPPALAYMRRHSDERDRLAEFFRKLERLAASMFVRRVYVNGRITRYGELLEQIEGAEFDVLTDTESAFDLSGSEKHETLERLKGDVYGVRRTRQFVLLRLDSALSEGTARYDYKTISVEHVLPQTPPPNSEWREQFDSREREFWTDRLANLVLLSRRKNSKAQNFEFERKKKQYFKSDDQVSPFALTSSVISENQWTPEVLAARQRRLVELLAETLQLGPAGDIPVSADDLPEVSL